MLHDTINFNMNLQQERKGFALWKILSLFYDLQVENAHHWTVLLYKDVAFSLVYTQDLFCTEVAVLDGLGMWT